MYKIHISRGVGTSEPNSENIKMEEKQFTIIKKIAKHGSQAVIIVPRMLERRLCPGTMVKLVIEVINDGEWLE